MLRAVPDVNILVSAVINPSTPPGRVVAAWRRDEIAFIISQPMMTKLEEVLHRPVLAIYEITDTQISQLLSALHQYAVVTPHKLNLQVIPEDPEDDNIIIAAVEGNAACIISGDKHLTKMGSYQDIPILSPAEFVIQHKIP